MSIDVDPNTDNSARIVNNSTISRSELKDRMGDLIFGGFRCYLSAPTGRLNPIRVCAIIFALVIAKLALISLVWRIVR
jgi:hypothetical protein